jgi:DNA-binding transcriptional MerR regulator
MEKSPDAFRTISEVAEKLNVPAHVLRFWESRFPQIKPVKRAGGRRYYRRADIDLLDGIRKLLHDDGMTIRGVQKILREDGIRRVVDQGRMPDDGAKIEAVPTQAGGDDTGDTRSPLAPGRADATPPSPAPADTEASSAAGPQDRAWRPETSASAPSSSDLAATAVGSRDLKGRQGPDEAAESHRSRAPDAVSPASPTDPASPGPGSAEVAEGAAPPSARAGAEDIERQPASTPVEPASPPDAPEAPMAEDVQPDEDESRVVPFARPAAEPVPGPAPGASSDTADRAADADQGPARRPDNPEIGPDPDDDDPAFALPPLDLSRIAADPARLRPLYDRLVTVRRKLGDAARRGPAP